jgi:hypothetical protein
MNNIRWLVIGTWWFRLLLLESSTLSSLAFECNTKRNVKHGSWSAVSMADSSSDASAASSLVPQAQDAMISPQMARSIRTLRSNRGVFVNPYLVRTRDDGLLINNTRTKTEIVSSTNLRNEKAARSRIIDNEQAYQSALAALKAYQSRYGDLIIPRRFIVPSEPFFPTDWHHKDLSSTVYSMKWWKLFIKNRPERVAELHSLGFIWERLQPEWNLVLEALITYRSIHKDVLVPFKFVVPRGDAQWPRATWGLALGSSVYRIRTRNDFLCGPSSGSRREQLNGLGFVWEVHEQRFRKFYAAVRHFAMLEKSGPFSTSGERKAVRIPSKFVVPQGKVWPEALWGYPLGDKATAVRQKDLYIKNKPRRQKMLSELGFRPTGNADLGWLKVVHAAAIYSRLHGRNLDVPLKFVVPAKPCHLSEDDWPWPEYLCGLSLGQRLKDVRVKRAYLSGELGEDRRKQLDALGMNWKPTKGRRKHTI